MSESRVQPEQMDAEAKRKAFWLLKRLTSYSLWDRKRNAWEVFMRAYEEAVKTWPADQPEQVPADNLPRIYQILSLYDEGLLELGRGNRSVWRDNGMLKRAIREYRVVSKFIYPHPDYWERGIQEAPYPPKIEVINKLMRSSEFHGEAASFEISDSVDKTALIQSVNWLLDPNAYRHSFYTLPYPVFPMPLPEVPAATDVVIRSGQQVPSDGIWEPVTVKRNRLLGLIPHGVVAAESHGCLNYFVRGVEAPKLTGEYNERLGRSNLIEAHWRLIWEDNRYRDGVIPDESEYFIEPKPTVAPREGGVSREYRTHEICPVSGVWQAVGYKNPPIHIAAGAVMPDLSVRDIKGEMVLHYVKWQLVQRD